MMLSCTILITSNNYTTAAALQLPQHTTACIDSMA
jgi:hypothetical protein